ncbi:MAG: DinB family protein [Bryobacterales bacterium]
MATSTPPLPPQPEPWLRGAIPGVDPLLAPVFFSFTQVREDLALHIRDLSPDDVWRQVGSVPALGFQLRHIAGSVDRLTSYLMDEQLSPDQIFCMKQESGPGPGLAGPGLAGPGVAGPGVAGPGVAGSSVAGSSVDPSGVDDLLAGVDAALASAEARMATIDPATIHEPRYIGRKRLPTTVLGLLVHIAEHTQRHLGQAITTAKLVRDSR